MDEEDQPHECLRDFLYWLCCMPCAVFQEALHVDLAAFLAEEPANKDDLYIPNLEAAKFRAETLGKEKDAKAAEAPGQEEMMNTTAGSGDDPFHMGTT